MSQQFLCIGDFICLYCEDTDGYVYGLNGSSVFNSLSIYQKQDRTKPHGVPDPQVILFQVSIQNRYKLNKKYQKSFTPTDLESLDHDVRQHARQARAAADAENVDNLSEQKRNQGKKVRYGEVIQLRHVFTDKFVHVNSTQTSQRDKNNMMLCLQLNNAKTAQFRILPRYKVKSEGEFIQIYDQITFESIKSQGHFFHASLPYQIDNFSLGSELNLGVELSGFTIVKSHSYLVENDNRVKGGDFVQLFHKELEAYVVAEGLFDETVTEQVHLRIREVNQLNPRTLRPSTSAITYWQIESEKSIIHGEALTWQQQFRFRHATTRMYLCVDDDKKVALVKDARDPRTVFKLHPVIQEAEEVSYESYARIEHVLSGSWLHALKDQEYKRKQFEDTEDERSMKALRWDGGELRKVVCVHDRRYDDAYTIQKVQPEHVIKFNYVAGSVPLIANLIADREKKRMLHAKEAYKVCLAFRDLRDFMMDNGKAIKARQKLLRNLRVIDLLVRLLNFPLRGVVDESNLVKVHKDCYDILYTYMIGSSRKNALYFAKYIEMFQSQMMEKSELGLKIVKMIVELIRDNRKIVDRISKKQIDQFVSILRTIQNSLYLELLEVLCVCNGVAIADNQSYIAEKWLLEDQRGVYLSERGQNIHEQPNIIYISTDCTKTWVALHRFLDKTRSEYDEGQVAFFRKQMDLFKALCFGRNEYCIRLITKDLGYLSWEEGFLSLQSQILPDDIRAKYCELIIGLFVDVGNNYSVVDCPQLALIYEYVGTKDLNKTASSDQYAAKDLVTIFPALRDWLNAFLDENKYMISSEKHHNMLIEQVLRLLHYLVKFGYYGDVEDLQKLLPPLVSLLDGTHDIPYSIDKQTRNDSKEYKRALQRYKLSERFEPNEQTEAVVNAKYASMQVLDLLLTFEANAKLAGFVTKFKECNDSEAGTRKKQKPSSLIPALYETFDAHSNKKANIFKQRSMVKELRDMFEGNAYASIEKLTSILLDLAQYKYNKMITMSLSVLNRLYSTKSTCFKMALSSLVLLTTDSCCVHREVARQVPLLRMMAMAKWTEEQVHRIEIVLHELTEFCHLPRAPKEPHPMNQKILDSHKVIPVILQILSAETDVQLAEKYSKTERVLRKAVNLMRAMLLQNPDVQHQIFEHLDSLLRVKLVESDLALALREVFVNNQNLCLKILPRQLHKIVSLAAESQERAPEFLDLLCSIVKVEGPNLALKRNQTLVMKYIMQNYSKVAYILEQSLDIRLSVLKGEWGGAHCQYLVSLIDLLANCSEGENRYIESLCQTILSVEDILKILNDPEIANELKRPFVRYFMFAYMKTTSANSASGAMDLLKDRCWEDLWRFLENMVEEIHCLGEAMAEVSHEQIFYFLTTPFPKNIAEHDSCPLCTEIVSGDTNRPLKLNHENAILRLKEDDYRVHSALHYLLDCFFPLLQTFASIFYRPEHQDNAHEGAVMDALTQVTVDLFTLLAPSMTIPNQLKLMINILTSLVPKSSHPPEIMEPVVNRIGKGEKIVNTVTQMKAGNREYYSHEIKLNLKLKLFAKNCALIYGGHNTVQAQLKFNNNRQYTKLNGPDALPLGEEFQTHVKCFVSCGNKKAAVRLRLAKLLVEQLAISAENTNFIASDISGAIVQRKEQEVLDIRSLQILRALIHNEERKLPEDWQTRTSEFRIKKGLRLLADVQTTIDAFQFCQKVLPHLASPSDEIAKEVLALQSLILFNANTSVQTSIMDYFLVTKEEVFFYAVRNRMQLSTANIKEKRLLQMQQQARKDEAKRHARNLKSTMTLGNAALKEIKLFENAYRMETAAAMLHSPEDMAASRKKTPKKSSHDRKSNEKRVLFTNNHAKGRANGTVGLSGDTDQKRLLGKEVEELAMQEVKVHSTGGDEEEEEVEDEEEDFDMNDQTISMKDDGYVDLVLKLLARICDGQHTCLQNYLREQPDNIKSYNLVGEVAQFLNVVYSNITNETIELVIEIFVTLNEFVAGNQDNRVTIYDNKIIDFINFILRAGDFPDCPIQQTLELRRVIGNLIISLIEENNPEATAIAKEVKDTLDKEALYRIMAECSEMYESEKAFNERMNLEHKGNGCCKRLFQGHAIKHLKETFFEVGFGYYMIMARLHDLDPALMKKALEKPLFEDALKESSPTEAQVKAFKTFRKNGLTVEILKEDYLQKVHFHVKNKNVLREQVKEIVKWNVDRTSPSNKIRDFMDWSKAILEDIRYQRRLQSNQVALFFTKGWMVWNILITILSLLINVIMLVKFDAVENGAFTRNFTAENADEDILASTFRQMKPEWHQGFKSYDLPMQILSISHNVLTFMVVFSYFISDHPSPPNLKGGLLWLRVKVIGKKGDEEEDQEFEKMTNTNKLTVSWLSFKTLYFLTFMALSVTGTLYSPFFFAFHLLHIVQNNQLLQGVISAVTQNGRSLIWVAILGLVVIYLYSIIAFLFFRSAFDTNKSLYCDTLWHCQLSVLRFGLIGDLFENMMPHDKEQSFDRFSAMVVFHLTFFILICTIGLNIIFGIIVDTFSELRNLKWTAESDMRDTCFICSRNSYDFEHHGIGFDTHVRQEHNMWAYLFFFIHLQDTKANDYTSLDLYVAKLLNEERYDFFPLNRALCLSAKDEDSTDSKIDDLLSNVRDLVRRQKEEDNEKKRFEEILRQKRWHKRHKMMRSHETLEEDNEDDDDMGGGPGAIALPSSLASHILRPTVGGERTSADYSDMAMSPPHEHCEHPQKPRKSSPTKGLSQQASTETTKITPHLEMPAPSSELASRRRTTPGSSSMAVEAESDDSDYGLGTDQLSPAARDSPKLPKDRFLDDSYHPTGSVSQTGLMETPAHRQAMRQQFRSVDDFADYPQEDPMSFLDEYEESSAAQHPQP